MSVRPTQFNKDGTVDIWHDDAGYQHGGQIRLSDCSFAKNIDGTDNFDFVIIHCPANCGSYSIHPISGGADRPKVQETFARKLMNEPKKVNGLKSNDITDVADYIADRSKKMEFNNMDGVPDTVFDQSAQDLKDNVR